MRFSNAEPKPGEPKTQDEIYAGIANAYSTIAKELNVRLIPVVDAFHLANRDPQWGFKPPATVFGDKHAKPGELPDQTHSLNVGYHWTTKLATDSHHANMAGEYLGACVWYEVMFGKSVENNTFAPKGFDVEYAKFLRGIAHQVVTETK